MRKVKWHLLFLMLLVALSGCAFSQVRLRGLIGKGLLVPGTSEDPSYRYYLGIACVQTSGWDGCNRSHREKTVVSLFSDACRDQKPEIYREDYVAAKPNDPTSFPVWVVKINCVTSN
jgi:hypothetical protein